MALTPSNMLPLGFTAPSFTLLDTKTNEQQSLSELQGAKGTLICFICNHCPFVVHIESCLVKMASKWINGGIGVIAISANDVVSYPQDGPDEMAQRAKDHGYPFSYLFDEDQSVAKAYGAACTPDFFLSDEQLACVYRGQFDDSRPGNNTPVSGNSLDEAVKNLLSGGEPIPEQKPSIGCNIKWKTA